MGERVLEGSEALLVRETIASLVDWIAFSEAQGDEFCGLDFVSGIGIFDALEGTQKLVLIDQAARYLLSPTDEVLPLNAMSEAVVGVIFEHLRQQVRTEIDMQRFGDEEDFSSDAWSWREQIRQTRLSLMDPGDDDPYACEDSVPPLASSTDMSDWDLQIELLADRILWDRDYELADSLLDADPDSAQLHRSSLGISDDYFSAVAPDMLETKVEEMLTGLRQFVNNKPR